MPSCLRVLTTNIHHTTIPYTCGAQTDPIDILEKGRSKPVKINRHPVPSRYRESSDVGKLDLTHQGDWQSPLSEF